MRSNKGVPLLYFVTVILLSNGYAHADIPIFPPVGFEFRRISPDDWETLASIPDKDYVEAAELGVQSINRDTTLENNLRFRGIVTEHTSEAYNAFLEGKPTAKSRQLDEIARKVMKSNAYFVNKHCLPQNIAPEVCAQYLMTKSLPENTDIYRKCHETDNRSRYSYTRLLPPRYKDGVYQMIAEPAVPRPRILTRATDYPTKADQNYPDYNLLVVQWAQFIEHDLSKPVSTAMHNGNSINCCTSDQRMLAPRFKHPACAPLEGNEPRNEYTHVSCQNYVRSAQTLNSNCTFGPAVMLNQENGKLDLSQLYGLTPEARANMRTFRNGLLKSSADTNLKGSLLPFANDSPGFCVGMDSDKCYVAGDTRVNSNIFMRQLYTIFLRSHNIIAEKLKEENPRYTDDDIFTLARKRNIEEYVAIIYDWWLPTILGESVAKSVKNDRPVQIQNAVSSEFGVAVIRFYQSMMPDTIKLGKYCVTSSLDLSNYMYNSDFLNRNCEIDSLLDGMLASNPHKVDLYYKSIILKNCLKSRDSDNGIDCLALDIQRGRDHGLASYTKYLEKCADTEIRDWKSLEAYIGPHELNILKTIYGDVNDIDLIVGAMSEKTTEGLLGVTSSCIIADQFSKIWNQMYNKADYNKESTVAAQLLCRTTGIEAVPMNIFKIKSRSNLLVNC